MELVALFLIYGILGWVLDSGYRSITGRTWTMGNALAPVPFAPVYAFGAFMLLGVEQWIVGIPLLLQCFVFGFLLAGFEWMSGVFSEFFFRRRLWSYGNEDGLLSGYTDLFHVGMWGMLAIVFLQIVHPFVIASLRLPLTG